MSTILNSSLMSRVGTSSLMVRGDDIPLIPPEVGKVSAVCILSTSKLPSKILSHTYIHT